ncbi:hypothetical protein COY62_00470, partial [bacterium (Candidatus Howlettbacteria) CG_4_10_14_0_8_um_filter_40_9]
DLLLQLIEGEKLDITQISLGKITDEYLEHLNDLDARSHDVAEFLVIASRLIYIKSKAIIPTPPTAEEEGEIEDMENKLREYKKYKEVAAIFHETLESGYRSFQRKNGPKFQIQKFTPPAGINLKMLMNILQEVLAAAPEEEVQEKEEVYERKVSVEEKLQELKTLISKKKRFKFTEILKKAKSKHEVIISFLAVLDLIKQKNITVTQDNAFGDIIIYVSK